MRNGVEIGSGQAKELKLNGMISKVDTILAQYSRFLGQKEQFYRRTWTQSIAIGGERFVKNIKQAFGIRAKGRKVVESGEAYQLREPQVFHPANLDLENDDIGTENTYFRDVYQ